MTQKYASPENAYEQIMVSHLRRLRALPTSTPDRGEMIDEACDMLDLFYWALRDRGMISDQATPRRPYVSISAGLR